LGEPFSRIANSPDNSSAQVLLPSNPVVQLVPDGIEEQPVYRKIPACCIRHGIAEDDVLRMATVLVIGFRAERRDLELVLLFQNYDYAELAPDRNGTGE